MVRARLSENQFNVIVQNCKTCFNCLRMVLFYTVNHTVKICNHKNTPSYLFLMNSYNKQTKNKTTKIAYFLASSSKHSCRCAVSACVTRNELDEVTGRCWIRVIKWTTDYGFKMNSGLYFLHAFLPAIPTHTRGKNRCELVGREY
jgi:hypothetical protein